MSEGTIAFVATTADRLGIGVEVVEVVPRSDEAARAAHRLGGHHHDQVTEASQRQLDATVGLLRERLGRHQPVGGQITQGAAVDTLVERSSEAQLLVLENHHPRHRHHVGHRSVLTAVAARAPVPVVAVPAHYRPAGANDPITVAVEDAARAGSELWTAIGMSTASRVPVVVLRAEYMVPAAEELLKSMATRDDLLRLAGHELAHDADLPLSVREGVPCSFQVRWGRTPQVLIEATHHSSLLVVARRQAVLPFESHLGPAVHQVLRHAVCPVMVVEPTIDTPVIPTAIQIAAASLLLLT